MSLFAELKRRNVFRVAAAYLTGAWLLVEVAGTLFPIYGLSDATVRIVVTLFTIGFPITLIISWVYELTPEGLKLEKDIDRAGPSPRESTRRLDRSIIVLLVLALGYFAFDKFVLDPRQDAQIAETAAQAGAEQALEQARLGTRNEKSIAVLPFADMSPGQDQEYFSDGLSDTLIHVLTQISGLKVMAKTSSFHFKGQNIDIGDIARQLNVGTILEGSVQKSGNRVRVIAQLINAGDGTHYWSKSFDRDLDDIFAVQDEISREVVEALKVTLLDTEQERLAQRYQPTLEAYEQLILGRHEMDKRTAASLAAAVRHFEKAIELDPDYVLPYVNLSYTYGLQVVHSGLVFEESLQRRRPLVEKAMQLDSLSGEAYGERASLNNNLQIKTAEEDRGAVEEDILKALELSPNNATVLRQYGGLLNSQGRLEEALVQLRLAAELDPMSPIIQVAIANAVWNVGRADEALALLRRNIERFPEFPNNYDYMGRFQARLGHLGEAQRWRQETRRQNPKDAYKWIRECVGFLGLGDVLSAENCANQLGEAHPEKVVSEGSWLEIYHYRGEWDAAIATLEPLRKRMPGFRFFTQQLAYYSAGQGDIERARRLMADVYPELLEDEVELSAMAIFSAVTFAAILNANGEIQQRDVLLVAMEKRIATLHRIHGDGYGILDVYIHAMRGHRDQAIAALREAIDVGWRATWPYYMVDSWWMLRQDWKLASLHKDPEFISMVEELEADIAAQRQWYEENKDKPLF